MDRFGRNFTRGRRGPKGDDGDDLINLLPKSIINLLKTIEFDLSCSLTDITDVKINKEKEIQFWYSKSNKKSLFSLLRSSAPILSNDWKNDGIIFPAQKKSTLECKEISLFSNSEGLLATTFRTISSTEGCLCSTSTLMANDSFREIRVTDKMVSFLGHHPDLKPFRYDISVDTSQWTTFVLVWSHKNVDENVCEFTCYMNDEIHNYVQHRQANS